MTLQPRDENHLHEGLVEDIHDFDAFDVGCIWTQVANTQVHRDRWNRAGKLHSDGLFAPQQDRSAADTAMFAECDVNVIASQPYRQDDVFDETQDQHATPESQSPWWKKGKTAPLLDQYDEQRRMWYMIQAGVFDHSTSVHDAVATRDTLTFDLTEDDEEAVSGQATEQAIDRTPSAKSLVTNVPCATATITAPQRATLSMAGNVNWPMAAAMPTTPIMQTPKRKTWSSTMAQRQISAAAVTARSAPGSASASAKKRKARRAKQTNTR